MMDLLTGPTNLLGVEKYCTVKSLGKICLLDIFFFLLSCQENSSALSTS